MNSFTQYQLTENVANALVEYGVKADKLNVHKAVVHLLGQLNDYEWVREEIRHMVENELLEYEEV